MHCEFDKDGHLVVTPSTHAERIALEYWYSTTPQSMEKGLIIKPVQAPLAYAPQKYWQNNQDAPPPVRGTIPL